MGLLNNLMSKIFGHAGASSTAGSVATPTAGAVGSSAPPATTTAQGAQSSAPTTGSSGAAAAAPASQPVDVAAILDGLAAKNSEKLDWKHSIVDLMKLVGMDSSLGARKQLATELHYSGDQNDSASMNIWLQKQVLRKLSENGGKVPQELLR